MTTQTENKIWSPTERKILSPVVGYNAIAAFYDDWYWNDFWNTNEAPFVQAAIAEVPPGVFLDAGCGTGRYRSAIERCGHHYIGIDVSDAMLELNQRKAFLSKASPPAEFYVGDLRECPVASASIDGVLCARTLSHIDDLPATFNEFRRVMRSGGLCIITDVHSDHPYQHTSIPGTNGKVAIETYKWTPEEIFASVHAAGEFEVVAYREFTLSQLQSCPAFSQFGKLYACPERKIFYTLVLRKRMTHESTLRPYL